MNENATPELIDVDRFQAVVEQAMIQVQKERFDYRPYLQTYRSTGDYLNFSHRRIAPGAKFRFDDDGIPQVRYGQNWYDNPVTLAQHGLHLHGLMLQGKVNQDAVTRIVDRLLLLQDEVGAFRYPFHWKYYLAEQPFEPGWVSAMAQGQALSLLARVADFAPSHQSCEHAGEAALSFLLTPIEQGGVMTTLGDFHPPWGNHVYFEEFICHPNSYTLNGYMFALLGLYDWAEQMQSGTARQHFAAGLSSLKLLLPYYDVGGISAYDLGFITHGATPHISPTYHGIHIYLLHALYTITGDQTLKLFANIWASYLKLSQPPFHWIYQRWRWKLFKALQVHPLVQLLKKRR